MNFNELINEDLASELIKSLMNGEDFSYAKDGLTIKAGVDGESINLTCSYAPNADTYKEERENFYEFCDDMDEDLFVEVCESIDNLKEVNDMIAGNEVREGIDIFTQALSRIATEKVAKLNKNISTIIKELEALKAERDNLLKYID